MSDPVQRRTQPASDVGSVQRSDSAGSLPPSGETAGSAAASAPRRSRTILLTLAGVGALALGYGVYDAVQSDEPQAAAEEQRDGYSTREECERNYSKEQCTPGQTYRPGVGFMPIFWGPYYGAGSGFVGRSNLDPGPGRVSRGTVTETRPAPSSQRGGFGSSARGHAGTGAS